MSQYGIKETKDALEFVISLESALRKTLADGKISIWEVPNFLQPFMKLGSAVDGIKLIPAEVKDLDDAEVAEMKAFVKERLDLPDDKLEEKINEALAIVLAIAKFIGGLHA